MIESEYNAGIASGAIKVESEPEEAPQETSSSPASSISIEQFIPLLTQLQSTQRCLTSAPTFIPQTLIEQIQFVFTGGNYYCYLYFNNQWNSFSVTGGGGATVAQLLAGTGISISPAGGTGTVTITNTGVTSIIAGAGVTVSSPTGAVTISAPASGVTSLIAGSGITVSSPTGNVTIATSGPAVTAKFGGTGADGALTLTSGTTNFNLSGAAVFIKNYTSISITGTAAVTFSNPHANGTIIVFRSQGNVTITSSANPAIDATGMGSAGGVPGVANVFPAPAGNSYGPYSYQGTITSGKGGQSADNSGAGGASVVASGSNGTGAGATGGTPPTHIVTTTNVSFMIWPAIPGSGGGTGASNNGSIGGPGGGAGGGGFYCECAGALNVTSILNSNGVAGSNATGGQMGGGGGGGAGCIIFLYNVLTANTATFNTNGGAGGTGGSIDFFPGGAGANGFSAVQPNLIFT